MMKTQFDIKKILELGKIRDELDFERALIADRTLRILAKDDPKLTEVRKKLRDLILDYESENWSDRSRISEKKLQESDMAEIVADKERSFIERRRNLIKGELKRFELNQQELGIILGHKSKSYMSELMHGVSPFSLRDLVVIHRLLKIPLTELVPTFLSPSEQLKIKSSIEKLGNSKLKLNETGFALA